MNNVSLNKIEHFIFTFLPYNSITIRYYEDHYGYLNYVYKNL